MDTGLRPSELQATETANLRGRLLTLRRTKNGRTRTVPLTQRALEAFSRQAHRHGSKPFDWASTPTLRHGWEWARNAMELASDTGFIMYALRHTCATRLYDRTRDLLLVQKWMGHTDIKMTLRYAKLMPGDLEAACEMLESPTASRRLAA
jgi:integrase